MPDPGSGVIPTIMLSDGNWRHIPGTKHESLTTLQTANQRGNQVAGLLRSTFDPVDFTVLSADQTESNHTWGMGLLNVW